MRLFKQHDIKFIGAFINILYLTMPLFGIVSYAMSAVTLYTVTLPYTKPIMPWFNLYIFFGILIGICFIAMFVFYKFLYPSYLAFVNKQSYIHNNPIQKDLQKIKIKLEIKDE
jgi:predicted membrane protein